MSDDTEYRDNDFITIVGTDIEAINRKFHTLGLAQNKYAIVHRVGTHRFAWAGDAGAGPQFDRKAFVAATFARSK